MAGNQWDEKRYFITAIDDLNIDSGSDTHEYVSAFPQIVTGYAFLSTTAVVKTGGAKVTVNHRLIVGSAAGATDVDVWTVPAMVAGKMGYRSVKMMDQSTSATGTQVTASGALYTLSKSPNAVNGFNLIPGQSLLFTVSTAADSGAGILVVEYVPLAFAGATLLANVTEDTSDNGL